MYHDIASNAIETMEKHLRRSVVSNKQYPYSLKLLNQVLIKKRMTIFGSSSINYKEKLLVNYNHISLYSNYKHLHNKY